MKTRILLIIVLALALEFASVAVADESASPRTKIVMLGTGTPNPEPDRSGPALAIIVDDTPYLVDFGPGVVRRAAAMTPRFGGDIEALSMKNLNVAFLTHLHSDHSAGLPDLILTPWVEGRDQPLQLYGPEGIADMASHVLQAYKADIRYRIDGLQPANDLGWRVNAHTLDSYLRAHLNKIGPRDYLALLAYVEMNAPHQQALQSVRMAIRDAKKTATCLGFGPRFLHSTGQAYKGGPNQGVVIQLTCDDPTDVVVPGRSYSFSVVKAAQARGDFTVLEERKRRALRIHVSDVAEGLRQFADAVNEALA